MITLVDVIKNGKRILGYNCLEDERIVFLTKEEVVEEIKTGNCLNGKVQEYKGSIIVRILDNCTNGDKPKVIDLETMPHIDSFTTVTRAVNPLYRF